MKKFIVMMIAVFCFGWNGAYAANGMNTLSSFRCGDDVVSQGDSKIQVELRCGDPSFKEQEGVSKTIRRGPEGARYAYKSRTVAREVWYYNRGPSDFIYVLTFEGGILKSITENGYGR